MAQTQMSIGAVHIPLKCFTNWISCVYVARSGRCDVTHTIRRYKSNKSSLIGKAASSEIQNLINKQHKTK